MSKKRKETIPRDGPEAKIAREMLRKALRDPENQTGHATIAAITAQELGYPELALEMIKDYGLRVRTYDREG